MNEELIKSLGTVLSNIYMFSFKTQHFHWNVTGSDFYQLHLLFERLYNDASAEIDRVAEHLRGYGSIVPGSPSLYIQLATIQETTSVPAPNQMLEILIQDVSVSIESFNNLASAAVDQQGTLNIVGDLVEKWQSFGFLLQAQARGLGGTV